MCVRYIAYLFCSILLISFAFLFLFLCVSAPVPTSFWAVLCTTDSVLGIRAWFPPQGEHHSQHCSDLRVG